MQASGQMLVVLCALCALPVFAADATVSSHTLASNISLVSNYVFRGIAKTSSNPAVQGGMDYAHASGLYAGLWGSPVSWIIDSGAVDTAQYGRPTTEADIYFGYKNSLATDYHFDAGLIRYNYLGNYTAASGYALADTAEVYGAISYKFLTVKYSWSVLDQFMTIRDTKGTNYIELNARYNVPDSDYTLNAHIGKQTYTGKTAATLESNGTSASYADYRLGIARDFSGYSLALTYTHTNASSFYTYARTIGGNWAGPATAVSLTRSF
ncbi:MAG: hypothetical protein B7Y56_14105 [Gallionellales bacterium 35-53-114]|jgi:uncharacterized protein (TIGR02001 family)|nr:MAG: hypothetical protein B7Y56_14105 [Gallionellales bacterium 35-53-114]OYZ62339.1 MAG: hypothetical protein B7Y04_14355 [Gallionellales bacterium 24-53-125]OZB07379.1 MAG: hypothetical protein B7X61_14775 [Gallionellales bacterium 39-52-133]HQS59552.1 TorF family putative porin [Gallionellaceae bacterium]HQS75545.1 TorF family putative porin [Gallionellaceae bacterium]